MGAAGTRAASAPGSGGARPPGQLSRKARRLCPGARVRLAPGGAGALARGGPPALDALVGARYRLCHLRNNSLEPLAGKRLRRILHPGLSGRVAGVEHLNDFLLGPSKAQSMKKTYKTHKTGISVFFLPYSVDSHKGYKDCCFLIHHNL